MRNTGDPASACAPLKALTGPLRRRLAQFGISAPVAPWQVEARQTLPVTVQSWLETEFASIQREAHRLKAPLWFVTARSVKSLTLPAHFKEFGALQVWLAVGGRNEFRFMFAAAGEMVGTVSVFVRRLLADKPRPVVLVIDAPEHPVVFRTRWPARQTLLAVEGGGVDTLLRL